MSKSRRRSIAICYLCGVDLGKDRTKDHVPPSQFFPEAFRRTSGPQLVTLPAHRACNSEYQQDEEYVVATLAGFAANSPVGRLLWQDVRSKFSRDRGQSLLRMVASEFDKRPAGLVLPPRKIAKRFNSARIQRVMHKIARGLYFLENGALLPDSAPFVRLVLPGEDPPPEIAMILQEPERGAYPSVFAYRYKKFPAPDSLHVWAFWLWDSIACSVVSDAAQCEEAL
jgi:hypothetical protein